MKISARMFRPSYATIIAGFTKTIDKLENLVELNTLDFEANEQLIAELELENGNLKAESEKATVTATKLRNLLGG